MTSVKSHSVWYKVSQKDIVGQWCLTYRRSNHFFYCWTFAQEYFVLAKAVTWPQSTDGAAVSLLKARLKPARSEDGWQSVAREDTECLLTSVASRQSLTARIKYDDFIWGLQVCVNLSNYFLFPKNRGDNSENLYVCVKAASWHFNLTAIVSFQIQYAAAQSQKTKCFHQLHSITPPLQIHCDLEYFYTRWRRNTVYCNPVLMSELGSTTHYKLISSWFSQCLRWTWRAE